MNITEKFNEYFEHTGQYLFHRDMSRSDFAEIAKMIFEAGHAMASEYLVINNGISNTSQESFQFIIGEDSDGNDIWHNIAETPFYFGCAYKGIETDYPHGVWDKSFSISSSEHEVGVTIRNTEFLIFVDDAEYPEVFANQRAFKVSLQGEYLVVEEFIIQM
jgi:hypothetical protein